MPTYPLEDLYSQQICQSYQKLLQIYSGSLVLNGSGSQLQFLDITASYVANNCCLITSSAYPVTSSWSDYSTSASYAPCNCPLLQTSSTYPITSSWALNSTTSSYSLNTLTASYLLNNCCLITSSTYPITSSWAVNTLTSSYILVSNVSHPIKTVSNDYNVSLGDYTVLCDASTSILNVKLPSAASSYTQIFNIKKIDSSGNNVHVTTTAANNIDFSVTQSIAFTGTNLSVQSDGTQYWIL